MPHALNTVLFKIVSKFVSHNKFQLYMSVPVSLYTYKFVLPGKVVINLSNANKLSVLS